MDLLGLLNVATPFVIPSVTPPPPSASILWSSFQIGSVAYVVLQSS